MDMIFVIGGACQGQYEFAREELGFSQKEIFSDFHLFFRQWLAQGKDPEEAVEAIFKEGYKVIVSNEIGLGIVPVDEEQRRWREETGRAHCRIAKRCGEVYRLTAGISEKIKG